MPNKYIEKPFLYLIVVSLLLHIGIFAIVRYLPETRKEPPSEPVFIDLQQIPAVKQQKPVEQEVKRSSDQRIRVERESAPLGDSLHETAPAVPRQSAASQPPVATAINPGGTPSASKPSMPLPTERRDSKVAPGSSVSSLLRPRQQTAQQQSPAQLFPAADRLARLEETYRRRYEKDLAEGDTRFLNSNYIHFGSFLRRFETAGYGVWRYPAEAAKKGVVGITPVKITFSKGGEIVHIQLLESSGSKILDEEVFRTLKEVGPVGAFPRGYDRDEFNLIAFFQYGMGGKSLW
ncbi:MAG: TonB family protein [Deltaproteobacteria bacterium]